MLATAAVVGDADLERGTHPSGSVWCVSFVLHPSPAVTERAADLVAGRCRRSGVGLVLRFRANPDPGRLLRMPPLPLGAFRDIDAVAVEVPDSYYLTDACTLVLPPGAAMAHAVVAALHREVDVGHCRGDELLATLDALGPPAALRRALAHGVASHAERYLVEALGGEAAAIGAVVAASPRV
jgi:hypothetical protein